MELSKQHQDAVRAEQAAAAQREAELQAQEAAQVAQKQHEAEAAQAALEERRAAQQVSPCTESAAMSGLSAGIMAYVHSMQASARALAC